MLKLKLKADGYVEGKVDVYDGIGFYVEVDVEVEGDGEVDLF